MAPSKPSGGGLVYSTESGRMCPACRQPVKSCRCSLASATALAGDGIVRLGIETKGRNGKGVTVVRGVALDPEALAALGKRLRRACGAGGTLKAGVLEIQGDHRDAVEGLLQAEGFKVKRSGG